MDIKQYVTKQLARTKTKKYEAYVIHRIIAKIDDIGLKFVTQQYVNRGEKSENGKKFALTDLYFPQLGIHIEVDEEHHFNADAKEADAMRTRDIVSQTSGHNVLRVNATGPSLEEINASIDAVVEIIKTVRDNLLDFMPWDIETEYSVDTYIAMGEIDANKDVALRTSAEVCNCFGHNYKGWYKGGAKHPHENNTILWFPKLYENDGWNNQLSDDETRITEGSVDQQKQKQHFDDFMKNHITATRRIVFARVRSNLGDVMYRFRGVYEVSKEETEKNGRLVWLRTSTTTKTYAKNSKEK